MIGAGIMIALAADNHTLICLTPHGLEVRLPSEPAALEAQLRQMLLALRRPKQTIPQDFSIVLSEWRRLDELGPSRHGAGKIPRPGTATAAQRPAIAQRSAVIRTPSGTREKNFIPLEQLPDL
jgi:hypothetical protein